MKNILILSASPRKNGNSDILCRQFIKGAQAAGHKTELISLYDKSTGRRAKWKERKQCRKPIRPAAGHYIEQFGESGEGIAEKRTFYDSYEGLCQYGIIWRLWNAAAYLSWK